MNKKVLMIAIIITLIVTVAVVLFGMNSGMKATMTLYNSAGKEIQASSLKAGQIFSANIHIDLTKEKEYQNTQIVLKMPDGVFLQEVQQSDIIQDVTWENGNVIIRLNETFRAPSGLIVRTTMQVAKSGTNYDVLTGSVETKCGIWHISKKLSKQRFGEIIP